MASFVCYSPFHNATLAQLQPSRIVELLQTWQNEYHLLGDRPEVQHLLVFENKGQVVGVFNPLTLIAKSTATNFVFKAIEQESAVCSRYWKDVGVDSSRTLSDTELNGRRIIRNRIGDCLRPYFSHAMLMKHPSLFQNSNMPVWQSSRLGINDLAIVLRNVLVRFDNLWRISFPDVMMLHQAPTDGRTHDGFHFHINLSASARTELTEVPAGPGAGGGNFPE